MPDKLCPGHSRSQGPDVQASEKPLGKSVDLARSYSPNATPFPSLNVSRSTPTAKPRRQKPIPLETPTTLELQPGNEIQVTLFEANHCPGAVMFCASLSGPMWCRPIDRKFPVFEGGGKAVVYTGDIRSEPWFVNSVARSPTLVQYTGGIKTLDKIYLDTSFTDDVNFQTKAEGIAELLRKISVYPSDTIFHFQAWTYGYHSSMDLAEANANG